MKYAAARIGVSRQSLEVGNEGPFRMGSHDSLHHEGLLIMHTTINLESGQNLNKYIYIYKLSIQSIKTYSTVGSSIKIRTVNIGHTKKCDRQKAYSMFRALTVSKNHINPSNQM